MGRLRKRFNENGRRKKDIKILPAKEVVTVNSEDLQKQHVDDSNALVLPSKKRKTKDVTKSQAFVRVLSKKQRKRLEYIVQRKEKKEKRAGLLESLQKVQGEAGLLEHLSSVSAVQTLGLKRTQAIERVRSVGGGKKARVSSVRDDEISGVVEQSVNDPSIIGTEVVETESSDDSDEEATVDELPPVVPVEFESADQELAKPVEQSMTSTPVVPEDPATALDLQYTPVNRAALIQEARLKLPILAEEQIIVEAVRQHPVVVVAGETGSGKTTQVPQFLYEAGYARHRMIGITEPRRVAAISMSRRIAEEMSLSSDHVSYQIRFEGNVTDSTRLKFMTDGVLLKEIESDFLLTKYSVVILDEAHERSVFTDILVGLLSRIVLVRQKRRCPLKLIIMSATLRVEDFTENQRLFKIPPPVIKVDSRQFTVTIHWNKRTPDDYVGEAFRKACKIHRTLPAGGILIFVTGQSEVNNLVHRLRNTFPYKQGTSNSSVTTPGKPVVKSDVSSEKAPECLTEKEEDDLFFNPKRKTPKKLPNVLPDINLDNYSVQPPAEETEDLMEGSDIDISDVEDDVTENVGEAFSHQPLDVRPLYAMLSTDKQTSVFDPAAEGSRLCVVATNIAETSLTIPGIRYVLDTGKIKQKVYDKTTGISAFRVMWESQAAANQRAGRAGRLGPGHCYRLFSSAVFNDEFLPFAKPEIQRRPVEDVVLQMKSMCVDRVVNFPFPSPPDAEQLTAAEGKLMTLGALEPVEGQTGTKASRGQPAQTRVTALGRAMSCFPVSPRFGKMLALSSQHGLLPYSVCLVAALTVPELLLENPLPATSSCPASGQQLSEWAAQRRQWAGTGQSRLLGDAMVLLRAVGAAEFADLAPTFCRRHGLRLKAVRETRKLRVQLTNEINLVVSDAELAVDPRMPPPSPLQCRLLRQLMLAALPDHVARKVDPVDVPNAEERPRWKNAYRCLDTAEPVLLHRDSALRRDMPLYVVYQEIHETSRLYMRGVTAIDPEWLAAFCPDQCTFGAPLDEPPPAFDPVSGRVRCHVTATFGRAVWRLPVVEVDYPAGADRYRRFAVHLLAGDVAPKLKQFCGALLAPPIVMTKSWAGLQPRTERLLEALLAERVDCRDALLQTWRRRPDYLLAAYRHWLPEVLHERLEGTWPPVERSHEDRQID